MAWLENLGLVALDSINGESKHQQQNMQTSGASRAFILRLLQQHNESSAWFRVKYHQMLLDSQLHTLTRSHKLLLAPLMLWTMESILVAECIKVGVYRYLTPSCLQLSECEVTWRNIGFGYAGNSTIKPGFK
jgi:hypothetical protein